MDRDNQCLMDESNKELWKTIASAMAVTCLPLSVSFDLLRTCLKTALYDELENTACKLLDWLGADQALRSVEQVERLEKVAWTMLR